MYLLLLASVAGVQLLLWSGSPHEALKGRKTTCTCCSQDAGNAREREWLVGKDGRCRVVRNRGVGGELFVGDSGLSWMRKRVIVFSRCRSYYVLCISSCDYDRPAHLMQVTLRLLQ